MNIYFYSNTVKLYKILTQIVKINKINKSEYNKNKIYKRNGSIRQNDNILSNGLLLPYYNYY